MISTPTSPRRDVTFSFFMPPAIARTALFLLVLPLSFMACSAHATEADPQTQEKPSEKKSTDEKAGASTDDAKTEKPDIGKNPFPGRFDAPSFDGGHGWLNTSGEIDIKDLRGKIVLLDFWTYCCINCMHVLPDLEYLEEKYDKQIVVIGVHSAKFENEKDTKAIRDAIMRYEIKHPVINDADMVVWRKFGARAWPTLVIIDPEGKYVGYLSGEGNRDVMEQVIVKMADYHRTKGTLDETPVKFALEAEKRNPTPLKYPGKVLADEANNRLFISDSNHNRILITDLNGKLQETIGSGQLGADDGGYDVASFDHPQGMELVGNTLYVADTENHLLREIDLTKKTVSTLAGTGEQARFRASGGALETTALNSPWAISHLDGKLYIAMAGPHQLWVHEIGSKTIQNYAGSGREDILDGRLLESALAQPSGITNDGTDLFFVDSEGSAVRVVDRDAKDGPEVLTIAGPRDLPNGRSLFEFDDIDDKGAKARFQHPLGIVYHEGLLYVADSYNHKLKTVNPETGEAKTWIGTGKAGNSLDPIQFSEPAGLSIAKGKLYIADTNNHRILTADLKSGKVAQLKLEGVKPPKPAKSSGSSVSAKGKAVSVNPQSIKLGDTLGITISFELPEGYKLNPLSPLLYSVTADDGQRLLDVGIVGKRKAVQPEAGAKQVSISLPLQTSAAKGSFTLTVNYQYCRDGKGGVCKLGSAKWTIPVEVSADAKGSEISVTAKPAN